MKQGKMILLGACALIAMMAATAVRALEATSTATSTAGIACASASNCTAYMPRPVCLSDSTLQTTYPRCLNKICDFNNKKQTTCASSSKCLNGACIFSWCGNGRLDAGEQCDGAKLNNKTCINLNLGYKGGNLACNSNCTFNYYGCSSTATIGVDCIASSDCSSLEATLPRRHCLDSGSYGYSYATCSSNKCKVVTITAKCGLTEACNNGSCAKIPVCGNGTRETTEQCEGNNLGGASCKSLGYSAGTLTCKSNCTYNTSGCSNVSNVNPYTCSDSDGGKAYNIRGTVLFTDNYGKVVANSANTDFCQDSIRLAEFSCGANKQNLEYYSCPNGCSNGACRMTGAPICGNRQIEAGEVCDKDNLSGKTCQSFGFVGGQLKCNSACSAYDFSACAAKATIPVDVSLDRWAKLINDSGRSVAGLNAYLAAVNTKKNVKLQKSNMAKVNRLADSYEKETNDQISSADIFCANNYVSYGTDKAKNLSAEQRLKVLANFIDLYGFPSGIGDWKLLLKMSSGQVLGIKTQSLFNVWNK